MTLGAATYAMGPGELNPGVEDRWGSVAPRPRSANPFYGPGVCLDRQLRGQAQARLGASGHDEDVGQGAKWGGGLGALGGVPGGVVGRGAGLAPSRSPQDALRAAFALNPDICASRGTWSSMAPAR